MIALLSFKTQAQTQFDTKYLQDGAYIFNDDLKITRENIFTTYKAQFGLGNDDEMKLYKTIVEEGNFHAKFFQYYKGYPVENGSMNVNGNKGVVLFANGNIIKNLNVNVSNPISESSALQTALDYIGATQYSWQDLETENSIKEEMENVNYTSYL